MIQSVRARVVAAMIVLGLVQAVGYVVLLRRPGPVAQTALGPDALVVWLIVQFLILHFGVARPAMREMVASRPTARPTTPTAVRTTLLQMIGVSVLFGALYRVMHHEAWRATFARSGAVLAFLLLSWAYAHRRLRRDGRPPERFPVVVTFGICIATGLTWTLLAAEPPTVRERLIQGVSAGLSGGLTLAVLNAIWTPRREPTAVNAANLAGGPPPPDAER